MANPGRKRATYQDILDAPERLHALDADLRAAKERVRGELASVWRDEVARWPERFADEPWRKAIAAAVC